MDNLIKLKKSFVDALIISEEIVNDDLAYQSIEQWDSISHMVLISQLEDDFGISIDTDDVIDLSSFGKAIEILKKYGVDFG
jgi:acyl carrier protein